MSKKKKFTPMKVYFNRETFRLEQKRAKEKLEHLSEGLKWCEKHIDVDKMSRREFLFDMEKAFSDEVIKQHGDIVKKALAVDKLYFLLDISIIELREIQKRADSITVKVGIKDEGYFCVVNEEDYYVMTQNEDDNEKLIRANNLIQALEMVGKYRKVFPADICRGTSNFLTYDLRENKYLLNTQELSSSSR